jgi:cell wall-associated NlpC family hydrolase
MSDIVRQMIEVAQQEAHDNERPRERCGVVVKEGNKPRLIECSNVHDNPHEFFRISAQEWAYLDIDHEVLSVWHTHPNGTAAPSQADRVMIEATGLPWHIVSWPEGGHSYTEPTGYEAPYEGRVFVHGILDCYALVRDWYRREMSVSLPNDDREDEWWNKGKNTYLDGFEKNGFVSMGADVRNLRRGDGILMQVVSKVPNHAAVYLGDGKILHHVHGKLSNITTYGGYWLKHTTHILRHREHL